MVFLYTQFLQRPFGFPRLWMRMLFGDKEGCGSGVPVKISSKAGYNPKIPQSLDVNRSIWTERKTRPIYIASLSSRLSSSAGFSSGVMQGPTFPFITPRPSPNPSQPGETSPRMRKQQSSYFERPPLRLSLLRPLKAREKKLKTKKGLPLSTRAREPASSGTARGTF